MRVLSTLILVLGAPNTVAVGSALSVSLIACRHIILGFAPVEQRAGMDKGWASIHERVRGHAEAWRK